jgi:hypothetical protein
VGKVPAGTDAVGQDSDIRIARIRHSAVRSQETDTRQRILHRLGDDLPRLCYLSCWVSTVRPGGIRDEQIRGGLDTF